MDKKRTSGIGRKGGGGERAENGPHISRDLDQAAPQSLLKASVTRLTKTRGETGRGGRPRSRPFGQGDFKITSSGAISIKGDASHQKRNSSGGRKACVLRKARGVKGWAYSVRQDCI